MKYIGNKAEQNINCGECKKMYAYTSAQQRQVILYYYMKETNCFVLKQFAICSEMTEYYSMYWVFSYDYTSNNLDTLKRDAMQIIDYVVIPLIENCQKNKIGLECIK